MKAGTVRHGCLIFVLAMTASTTECHKQPAVDQDLLAGLGLSVDVIGERIIDEHNDVHDYPSTGGSTVDERPFNMYDFDPAGTFSNLDYDSFAPRSHSHYDEVDASQHDSSRQPEGDQEQLASSDHLTFGYENYQDVAGRPTQFTERPLDDFLPKSYLLSIHPFSLDYLAPPSLFGEVYTPPPPVTVQSSTQSTTSTTDMVAGLMLGDIMINKTEAAARSTGRRTAMTSSNKRHTSKRRRRRRVKRVKPSVIIVKKIIPLSTTTTGY